MAPATNHSLPDPALAHALQQRLATDTGQPVTLVETPISWVLLTERRAYKLKKPVRLPFLDFSSAERRMFFCCEEYRLNHRLAPSLYVGVLPVCGTVAAPWLGGGGPVIDHVVSMRRFPDGALFREMLAAGTLTSAHVDALARRIADFHRDAPLAPLTEGAVADPGTAALAVLRQLEEGGFVGETTGLRAWVQAQAARLQDTWAARLRVGLVRECHGDLHLANIALVDGVPTAFDRLEFDAALRTNDVMSDVAFLTMDLKSHGRADLAFRFLDTYLQHTGDYEGLAGLRFFEVYRALVRTLVELERAPAPGGHGSSLAHAYFGLAVRLAQPERRAARLVITHGLSGSGKSSVAARMVEMLGAVRLRSDVERKRLFGLDPLQRSTGQPFDIYTPEATRRTLARMAEAARIGLRAGYPVIVDAAFLRHAERQAFCLLAEALGVPFSILHCHTEPATLRRRVLARYAAGDDPSEADQGVVDGQSNIREPLRDDELPFVIDVCTDAQVDLQALRQRCLETA